MKLPPANRMLLLLAAVFGIVILAVLITTPNYVRSGPSKRSYILNLLRQIDSAKQQWAFENGITDAAATNLLTEQILATYLKPSCFDRKGRFISKFGEKYTINALNRSPEAELTRQLENLPEGTIIRLGEKGEAYVLPGTKP
jgi:hypothetical protein